MSVSGLSVVVVGGGSGMGAAAARQAAREGAHVSIVDLDAARANHVAEEVARDGGSAIAFPCDVTDEAHLRRAAEQVEQAWGRVDGLLNFVGISDFGAAEEYELARWERQLLVNLTGTFLSCREFGRQMIRSGGGAIVNVSSTAGLFGVPSMAAYSASKHGVVGLTRALAVEWARFGIRVNCICPGATLTPMLLATTEEFRAARIRRIPAGRFGEPEEQAGLALFLVSPQSAYVNGAAIPVDGGVAAMAPGTSDAALISPQS